jgi:hypothetical protein
VPIDSSGTPWARRSRCSRGTSRSRAHECSPTGGSCPGATAARCGSGTPQARRPRCGSAGHRTGGPCLSNRTAGWSSTSSEQQSSFRIRASIRKGRAKNLRIFGMASGCAGLPSARPIPLAPRHPRRRGAAPGVRHPRLRPGDGARPRRAAHPVQDGHRPQAAPGVADVQVRKRRVGYQSNSRTLGRMSQP